MANKDLVVKMTIKSNDFDNGLKNAKASMNRFNSDAKGWGASFKSVVGTMTKAFGALGIAVGATDMFKSFINSTQTMSDKWGNAMMTAKTSFQVFESAVANGTGTILSNFSKSISAAREFARAMDDFGSAQISNQYARMEYVTPFQEAMTKYRDMKASGNTTGMAFAASDMQRMLQSYSDNSQTLMQKSMEAVTAKLSSYTGGFINSGNVNRYVDQLYLEIINGVFPPILQDFNNLETERRKGDYFANQAVAEMKEKYGPDWKREAEAMKALSEINDDALNDMLGVLKTYDQVRNVINSMRRQMNKVISGESPTTITPTVTTPTSLSTSPTMTADQQMQYLTGALQNEILNNDRIKDAMVIEFEIPEEEIEDDAAVIEEAVRRAREEMELMAITTQKAFVAANALAGAFDSFGQISDGTLGKMSKGLGSVISQIVATIQAMMALTGAETVEGIADVFANTKGGVWTKLAMSAIALSGIMGIIASAKSSFAGSYANGGIIGGNSYTGDKLWIRANSGEMVLNQSQQTRLLNNMNGGGQVRFVIEGSQLKGVLDNYDKTISL